MVNDQVVGIQSLELCVGLSVLQEVEKELCRLLGPTTLGSTVDLSL